MRGLARSTTPGFDWDAPESWPRALQGVDRLYATYSPDLAVPESAAAITHLVDVARDAGVGRIVLLSGRGEDGARRCEDILLASGVPATVVRSSWFVQNFTEGMLRDAVRSGVLALPAGGAREPFIDVDDIAEVVVEALTGEGHEGRVYEVTGPELLTFADMAALLSELHGRDVRYLPVGFDEFHAAVAADAGPEVATMLTELSREVFDGRNESVASGVFEALGRPPRDARTVLAQAALAGVWA
ncbi:NAD(P)H-binding protein [Agromyces bracchium]